MKTNANTDSPAPATPLGTWDRLLIIILITVGIGGLLTFGAMYVADAMAAKEPRLECPHCGKSLSPRAESCPKCGDPLRF